MDQKLSTAGMWLLAAAFFFMPLNALRLTTDLTYGDVFVVFAFGIAALLLVTRSRSLPKLPVWFWAGGAILLLSIVIVQLFPPESITKLNISFPDFDGVSPGSNSVKLIGAMFVFPLVVAIIVDSWKAVGLLVNAWIAGVTVSCAVAMCDAYLGTGLQIGLAYDPEMTRGFIELIDPARHYGLTVHPNALSLTAMLSMPLVLAKMTDARRVMMLSPVLLLMVFALFLSGSRIGLVGFALALLFTLVLNPVVRRTLITRDPRVVFTVIAGVAVTAVLLFLVPLHSFSLADKESGGPATISRVDSSDPSSQESDSLRRQYFEDSVEYIKERPLVGYGFQWVEASHDLYLQMLLSGGILALIGFLTVMVGYVRESWILRDRVPGRTRGLVLALGISVAVYLISGLLGNGILGRYLYLGPALLLAISLMISRGTGGLMDDQGSEA